MAEEYWFSVLAENPSKSGKRLKRQAWDGMGWGGLRAMDHRPPLGNIYSGTLVMLLTQPLKYTVTPWHLYIYCGTLTLSSCCWPSRSEKESITTGLCWHSLACSCDNALTVTLSRLSCCGAVVMSLQKSSPLQAAYWSSVGWHQTRWQGCSGWTRTSKKFSTFLQRPWSS